MAPDGRTVERLRREGMADACVLLVANRVLARLDLDDYARPLGLTRIELQDAVARFKARAVAFRRPNLQAIPGGTKSRRYTNPPRPCPKGCGRSFVHFGRHLEACAGEAS